MQKLLAWISATIKNFKAKMEHLEYIRTITEERRIAVDKFARIIMGIREANESFEARRVHNQRFMSLQERAKDRILYLDNTKVPTDPEDPNFDAFARHVSALEKYLKEMEEINKQYKR